MVHASVVPNSQVIYILPAIADLQVMVLDNQLDKPVEEMTGLLLGQPVDLLHMRSHRENALPTSYRVCADHWMVGFERITYVVRRTAGSGEDSETILLSCLCKSGLRVVGGERVEEALEGSRYTIVQFVSRCP